MKKLLVTLLSLGFMTMSSWAQSIDLSSNGAIQVEMNKKSCNSDVASQHKVMQPREVNTQAITNKHPHEKLSEAIKEE